MSYASVHKALRRHRGRAADQRCVDCGEVAEHWSLEPSATGLQQDVRGSYSTDLAHYAPRCRSCHWKLDGTVLNLPTDTSGERNGFFGRHHRPGLNAGESNGQAKLTAEQVAEMRRRVAAGARQNAMAREYGVSVMLVSLIVRGKRWAPSAIQS